METSSVSFVSTPQNRYGSSDREAALVGASELVNGLNDAPGNPVLVSGVGEPNLADREVVFVSNAGPGAREGESHDLFELCMQAIDERRISQDLVDRLRNLGPEALGMCLKRDSASILWGALDTRNTDLIYAVIGLHEGISAKDLGAILGQQNGSQETPLGWAVADYIKRIDENDPELIGDSCQQLDLLINLHEQKRKEGLNIEDLDISDALLGYNNEGRKHEAGAEVTEGGPHVLGYIAQSDQPWIKRDKRMCAVIELYRRLSRTDLKKALNHRFNGNNNALSFALENYHVAVTQKILDLYAALKVPDRQKLLQERVSSSDENPLLLAIICTQIYMKKLSKERVEEVISNNTTNLYRVFDLYIGAKEDQGSNDAFLVEVLDRREKFKCNRFSMRILVKMAMDNRLSLHVCEAIMGLVPSQQSELDDKARLSVADLQGYIDSKR